MRIAVAATPEMARALEHMPIEADSCVRLDVVEQSSAQTAERASSGQLSEPLWIPDSSGRVDESGFDDAVRLHDGDEIALGNITLRASHTPGHTPGSQCFLLDGRLVAGDTLFLDGCGRTDFPGGNVDDMFRSLQALAKLPGDPTVFPGHWYSEEPSAPLDEVKRSNYVYRASNLEQWRMLMGG